MNRADYLFEINLMSKARPRSIPGQIRPYMPVNYKVWMKDMRSRMAEWWVNPPLDEVSVIFMKFKGPARGDLDNLAGAVLDAGSGLIWADDRVSVVRALTLSWEKAPTKEQTIFLSIHWP